jgi:hypothetical protein
VERRQADAQPAGFTRRLHGLARGLQKNTAPCIALFTFNSANALKAQSPGIFQGEKQ